MKSTSSKAKAARAAALRMANLPTGVKDGALRLAASEILENQEKVLEANSEDVEYAERLRRRGKLSKAFVERLKLDESKLMNIVTMLESLVELEDPIGKTLYAAKLDNSLDLYKVSCPIGVIGAIFESRPDVLPQISGLCLKSGNAVILKGGREAERSNRALFDLMRDSTEGAGVPEGWIQLIEGRREVRELLGLEEHVDLLVPRGSKGFIKYVQAHTSIPVLGHAEGICHVYVDERADLEKALNVCYDAKVQYPAVCNAAETLLVHRSVAPGFLPRLADRYAGAGVEIRGCERTREIIRAKRATEADWRTEYLDLMISIKIVGSVDEAIEHINRYGSKHTDSIITEDPRTAIKFLEGVDSSSVMWNASTRFSDGYRYGLGAEVGISTGKIHARGPVGLEGLTISKYYLLGNGHVVSTYSGPSAKRFLHEPLEKKWRDVSLALGG